MNTFPVLLTISATSALVAFAFGFAPDEGVPAVSVAAPVQVNAAGTDVPPPRGGFGPQVVSRDDELWTIYRATSREERGLDVVLARVSSAEGVSDRVKLTEAAGEHLGPSLVADAEGNLHAGWFEARGRRGEENVIAYRGLAKDASTWGAVARAPAGRNRVAPLLGTGGSGEVFFVFPSTEVRGGNTGIRFLLSVDGGAMFQPVDVDFPEPIGFAAEPDFTTGAEREVVLVWTDQTPGGVATVLNRSADGGRTWFDEPVVVSDDRTVRTSQPKVLYAGDRMVVLWLVKAGTQYRVWLDHSPDEGKSWRGNRLILTREGDLFDWGVLNDGASLYLIWREGLRRGPIQHEKVGAQLFAVDGPVGEPFFPDLEGSTRILGFSGAVVEGRPLLSVLTLGPDRTIRASLHALHDGGRSMWREVLGGDLERTNYSLVSFPGGGALLYREGQPRWLPQQSPWRADLLLRAVSVTGR